LLAVFSAIAFAVLIARIERNCACTSRTFGAGRVETLQVAVLVLVLATAGALMTAKAAASETYQQKRTQANDTMKHCGQSDDLTSRHKCPRFGR